MGPAKDRQPSACKQPALLGPAADGLQLWPSSLLLGGAPRACLLQLLLITQGYLVTAWDQQQPRAQLAMRSGRLCSCSSYACTVLALSWCSLGARKLVLCVEGLLGLVALRYQPPYVV